MTLRPQVIRERLRKLREIVRNLERVRGVERKDFVSSYEHYWLGERGLQLAAEAVFGGPRPARFRRLPWWRGISCPSFCRRSDGGRHWRCPRP